MIDNEQEVQDLQPAETASPTFARVTGVYSDGLTIQLEGGFGQESTKHYPCNRSCVFSEGDRVRVVKDSGSYVVEYPVGSPITESTATVADKAHIADMALAVDNTASGGDNLVFYYKDKGHLYLRRAGGGSSDFVEFVAKGY